MKTRRYAIGPRQNYEGYTTGFVPASGPKSKKVMVPLRAVVCLDCNAAIGEPCVSLTTGAVKNQVHISRNRIATRKFNEERGI